MILLWKTHSFCEVGLLRFNLLTELLLAPKACFSPSNAGRNVKIRQLVNENGRLKDGYQVKLQANPIINNIQLSVGISSNLT